MVYCANCGMFMDDTMRTCPKCGAPNPNYAEPEAYLEKERRKNYRDMKALAMEDGIPWDRKGREENANREELLRKLGEWFAEGYEVGHLREVLNREPGAAVKVFQDYEIRIHQLRNMEKRIDAMDFLEPDVRARLTGLLKDPMKLDILRREIAEIEEKRKQKEIDPKKLEKANQWYNIGKALMVLEKYSDALNYFERALREHPGHEGAYEGKKRCEEALKAGSTATPPATPPPRPEPSIPEPEISSARELTPAAERKTAPPSVPEIPPAPAPQSLLSQEKSSEKTEAVPPPATATGTRRFSEKKLEEIREYAKQHAKRSEIPKPPRDVDEKFVEEILSAKGPTLKPQEEPSAARPSSAQSIPQKSSAPRRVTTPPAKGPEAQGVRTYRGTGVPGSYRERKTAPAGPPRPAGLSAPERKTQEGTDILEPVKELEKERRDIPPARTAHRKTAPRAAPATLKPQERSAAVSRPPRTKVPAAAPVPVKSPAANPGALYEKAKDALVKRNLDEALKFIDMALEVLPNNPDYLSLKGEILGRKKDLNGAIDYFDRALKLRPRDSAIMTLKGVALFQLGNYRESLRMCEMALRIDPSNAKALKGRAACMKKLGM